MMRGLCAAPLLLCCVQAVVANEINDVQVQFDIARLQDDGTEVFAKFTNRNARRLAAVYAECTVFDRSGKVTKVLTLIARNVEANAVIYESAFVSLSYETFGRADCRATDVAADD